MECDVNLRLTIPVAIPWIITMVGKDSQNKGVKRQYSTYIDEMNHIIHTVYLNATKPGGRMIVSESNIVGGIPIMRDTNALT